MLKELMLPAEVKLLKPNPAGCWHCVPAMMHGLAVLCGPSMLFRNGVPAPGKSVRLIAEAAPVRANVVAVATPASHDSRFMSRSLVDAWKIPKVGVIEHIGPDSLRAQRAFFGFSVDFLDSGPNLD